MTNEDWLATLEPSELARVQALVGRFEQLGASDPISQARSEVEDDLPQLARYVILHHLWTETIDPCRDDLAWIDNLIQDARRDPKGPFADAGQALERILAAGAKPRDVGLLARFLAYEAAFSVIHTLDYGYDPEREDELPGWALVERDESGQVTGREIDALHESLLEIDPTGREGRPG
jgi:hypothetical protein